MVLPEEGDGGDGPGLLRAGGEAVPPGLSHLGLGPVLIIDKARTSDLMNKLVSLRQSRYRI